MRRRDLLVVGGGVLTTGCVGGLSGDSPTSTPTDTPTDSPTPTPMSSPTPTATPVSPPKVLRIQLVTQWEEFGDLDEHAIRTADVGGTSTVAYRYRAWPHDGKIKTFEQTQVAGPTDGIGTFQNETEVIVESSGPQKFEGAVEFETTDTGTHTVEVLVRDEISGKVSEAVRNSFEVKQE